MGYGIRARRRGFVTAGHTTAITGSGTKTFVELGVPNGVTKLQVWMIGGGGGAGGGLDYRHSITYGLQVGEASAGGGGSGYVNSFTLNINSLDTFTYQCGSGGACGHCYVWDDVGWEQGHEELPQTSGVGGGSTTLVYNNVTYTASGGNTSPNTGTSSGQTGANASVGGNGGSGGGGGEVRQYKDTREWYSYYYWSNRGAGGQNGGSGYSSTRNPDTENNPTLRAGGSGAGVPTMPFGIASYLCGAGGNSSSTLGYGDGGQGIYWNRNTYRGGNGAIFFAWENGGI